MASDGADFAFIIKFARGTGDPRRIFDAASLLIEGFEELDQTIVQIVDGKIRPSMVLEDVRPGSIRVILKTLLGDIDEQALMDLNSFRAQHHLPPLSYSATLAGLAYEQAHSMASRNHLDHNGFKQRSAFSGGMHAENVAWGCATEDCAYTMWARSAGHRRNMLLREVSAYGIASATAGNGRTYWALELGN